MASEYVIDCYKVKVPGDVFSEDEALQQLANLAIDTARDRAALYCVPALWTAKLVSGSVGDFEVVFQVTRKRRRRLCKTTYRVHYGLQHTFHGSLGAAMVEFGNCFLHAQDCLKEETNATK